MLLKDYARVCVLMVDVRYEQHATRIKQMLSQQGVLPDRIRLFVSGEGKLYPREFYQQVITEKSVPPSWPKFLNFDGYSNFSAVQRVVREALDSKATEILLMEDDCSLTPEFDAVLGSVQQQLPRLPPWDCLYYGADHRWAEIVELSPNVIRCNRSFQFHCVGLRRNMMVEIAKQPPVNLMDCCVAYGFQSKYRAYAIWPSIAIQLPGWSVVCREHKSFASDARGTNVTEIKSP